MHISVLQEQVLLFFRSKMLKCFIDATLGAAGHSLAILEEHPELEQLIGFDRDLSALQIAKSRLPTNAILVHSNYASLREKLAPFAIASVDGILFDFGVSSMQLDQEARGFSFQSTGPLDMRMDQTQTLTAEDVVNSYREEDLARIIYEYGEERGSRKVAKAICQARKHGRIDSTEKLVQLLHSVLPRRGRLHPATKVFQALRMEVNQELESIKAGLEQAISCLAEGGILAVISFHSLEDRIVKYAFRAQDPSKFRLLTKKPVVAAFEEIRQNPRSRSAKLRVLQRISC